MVPKQMNLPIAANDVCIYIFALQTLSYILQLPFGLFWCIQLHDLDMLEERRTHLAKAMAIS